MLVLARDLDDGQAEDDGDKGQKNDAKAGVAAKAALVQFMFAMNCHHQPPIP